MAGGVSGSGIQPSGFSRPSVTGAMSDQKSPQYLELAMAPIKEWSWLRTHGPHYRVLVSLMPSRVQKLMRVKSIEAQSPSVVVKSG
ncbi:hypothetical protein TNCV_1710421 [Trichonephila clavipes]|nr:hypothetical protein TNCV_1710421 [Trichonephila clavipes]